MQGEAELGDHLSAPGLQDQSIIIVIIMAMTLKTVDNVDDDR